MRTLLVAMLVGAFLLTGCATTTEKELLQAQIDLYGQAIDQSQRTLDQLKASGGAPGPYEVKAYVAMPSLNSALSHLAGTSFPLPGDTATVVTLNGLKLSTYGSFPVVELDAQAKRGDLTLEVNIDAILIPTSTPGALKVRVLHFVPRAQWMSFEITKAQFVKDLLAVAVDKVTDAMPVLHLPTNINATLGGPAYTYDVTFPATPNANITMNVRVPATAWTAFVTPINYYFLNSGIYVFGAVAQ